MEKPNDRSPAPEYEPPMVPESEMKFEAIRSSGPGGQSVNKTNSKVRVRWNVGRSDVFDDDQKAKIRAYAGNRLNDADEIVLDTQSERSRLQNQEEVIARLQRLVAEALTPQKERKETKVSRGQKEQRLNEKKRESRKKQDRKGGRGEW